MFWRREPSWLLVEQNGDEFTYNDCVEVLESRSLILLSGDFKKYPIFGVNAVKINDRVICNDVNNILMPIACSNGTITVGRSGKCGNLICRGDVWLRDFSIINGDIRTSGNITYQNNITVTGNSFANINIPSSELPLVLPNMNDLVYSTSEMTNDIYVEPGNVCELVPGKYYNYNIKSNSKLKLTSGIYFFNKLDMDIGSSLELDEETGPIEIYIVSSFNMRGNIVHSLSDIDGPRNFLVGYCGTNTIFLDYGFSGTFVSPNARLVMGQAVKKYEGCFYAKSVEVHQDATIKHIPFGY